MLKSERKKSTLVISLILALIISTSFCLEFLVQSALAADFANSRADSDSQAMIRGAGIFDDCLPQEASQLSNKIKSDLIFPDNNKGIKECCLNTSHHPTTAVTSDSILNYNALLAPLIISLKNISLGSFDSYSPIPSPPPEASALRSIVKNE